MLKSGRASDVRNWPRALPDCRSDVIYARHLRYLPEPQKRHRVELMLLAVNINLVAFSSHLGDLVGQIFAILVLTVAVAEAAIGLAILVIYNRNHGTIAVEDVNMMKG